MKKYLIQLLFIQSILICTFYIYAGNENNNYIERKSNIHWGTVKDMNNIIIYKNDIDTSEPAKVYTIDMSNYYASQSFKLDEIQDGYNGSLVMYRSKKLLNGGREDDPDIDFYSVLRLIDNYGKTVDVDFSQNNFAIREEKMYKNDKRTFFIVERASSGHMGYHSKIKMFEIKDGQFIWIFAINQKNKGKRQISFDALGGGQIAWVCDDYPKQPLKIEPKENWNIVKSKREGFKDIIYKEIVEKEAYWKLSLPERNNFEGECCDINTIRFYFDENKWCWKQEK